MKILAPLAEEGRINLEASIRDSQSTIILAPIQKVWNILTDIKGWPNWNIAVKSVNFEEFVTESTFSWEMEDVTLSAMFRKIQEPDMLSWTVTATGLKGIHVWRLEETDNNSTIVTLDESFQGIRTLFYSHQKLHSTLLTWLECLKKRAEV